MSAEEGVNPTKDVKEKIYGKMYKIIEIISRLAEIEGFDKRRRIQLLSGEYMPNSNLAILITRVSQGTSRQGGG
jgi:hypothetical protein